MEAQQSFVNKPKNRKMLRLERVIEDKELNNKNCIFICYNNNKELILTFSPDFKDYKERKVTEPLEDDLGNLHDGIVKIINIGQQDLLIKQQNMKFYKNPEKPSVDFVKIPYSQDRYFVKISGRWNVY